MVTMGMLARASSLYSAHAKASPRAWCHQFASKVDLQHDICDLGIAAVPSILAGSRRR
jgi:hypothetical protein